MTSKYYQNKYKIASNRLNGYDYSSEGAYFVTICTENKEHRLGEFINEELIGNVYSQIAFKHWNDLPNHYPSCNLDQFVVMPNHIHGIIMIMYPIGTDIGKLDSIQKKEFKIYPVSEMIRAFKTFSTKKINEINNSKGTSFWQKNYYDKIIRSEEELNRIRECIYYNPMRWEWNKSFFEKCVLMKKGIPDD